MENHFDSLCAIEKVKSTLTEHGINHDGNADQVCAIESAMVIDHLNTLLVESHTLLQKAISVGFNGMSPEKHAEWLGTAEGTVSQSKYLMPKDVEQISVDVENHGNNIIGMHSWANDRKAKAQVSQKNNMPPLQFPISAVKN